MHCDHDSPLERGDIRGCGTLAVKHTTHSVQLIVSVCKDPIDVAFVIDSSGSIGDAAVKDGLDRKYYYRKILDFASDVARRLNDGGAVTPIGTVLFNSGVTDETPFENDLEEVIKTIDGYLPMGPGGGTKTGDALEAVRNDVFGSGDDRPDVDNVVIVITDGVATDQDKAISQAGLMKKQGAKILAIGVGPEKHQKELEEVVSNPVSRNAMWVENFDDIAEYIDRIKTSACEGI